MNKEAQQAANPIAVEQEQELKACLLFLKLLQPTEDNSQLLRGVHVAETILVDCSSSGGREQVLWLRTTANAEVRRLDKSPFWRQRLVRAFTASDPTEQPVAVRKTNHYRKPMGSVCTVLTGQMLHSLLHMRNGGSRGPSFAIQKFIRCRGANASIYRIVWHKHSPHANCAYNLINRNGFQPLPMPDEDLNNNRDHPLDLHERLLETGTQYASFYCASTDFPESLHVAKIRGSVTVNKGVELVEKIAAHAQAHLPGIVFEEMAADFIRDTNGKWWLVQVKSFRLKNHQKNLASLMEVRDSMITLPPRQSLVSSLSQTMKEGATAPRNKLGSSSMKCFLCGLVFTDVSLKTTDRFFPEKYKEMSKKINEVDTYRMTEKMVVDTISSLKQRGIQIRSWETAVRQILLLTGPTNCISCRFCYSVYVYEKQLQEISIQIYEYLNVTPSHSIAFGKHKTNAIKKTSETFINQNLIEETKTNQVAYMALKLQYDSESDDIDNFDNTITCLGKDIDPTCKQFRLLFFFHELQDLSVAGNKKPMNYQLEYSIGQVQNIIEFEGSKLHTAHRWQLWEVRNHYLMATHDNLYKYALDKKIQIKIKLKSTDEVEGVSVLSLKQIHTFSKGISSEKELCQGKTTILLPTKTKTLGLITLKLDLSLIIDAIPIVNSRHIFRDLTFISENSVFWPPITYYKPDLIMPIEWMIDLLSSEYVSNSPLKERNSNKIEAARKSSKRAQKSAAALIAANKKKPIAIEIKDIERSAVEFSYNLVMNIIHQVSGEGTKIPSFFLGTILQNSFFSTWNSPSQYVISSIMSLDGIYCDFSIDDISKISLCGELLLILLSNKLIPNILNSDRPENIRELLTKYWMYSTDKKLSISTINTPCTLQRVLWNRAVRHFKYHTKFENCSDKNTFYSGKRLLCLCSIFELFENNDCGYIDIAELRSFSNVMLYFSTGEVKEKCLRSYVNAIGISTEALIHDKITMLSILMEDQHKLSLLITIQILQQSQYFLSAFHKFDELGNGDTSIEEFCDMGMKAFNEANVSLKRKTGFCIRHGFGDFFTEDIICINCASEFNNPHLCNIVKIANKNRRNSVETSDSDSSYDSTVYDSKNITISVNSDDENDETNSKFNEDSASPPNCTLDQPENQIFLDNVEKRILNSFSAAPGCRSGSVFFRKQSAPPSESSLGELLAELKAAEEIIQEQEHLNTDTLKKRKSTSVGGKRRIQKSQSQINIVKYKNDGETSADVLKVKAMTKNKQKKSVIRLNHYNKFPNKLQQMNQLFDLGMEYLPSSKILENEVLKRGKKLKAPNKYKSKKLVDQIFNTEKRQQQLNEKVLSELQSVKHEIAALIKQKK